MRNREYNIQGRMTMTLPPGPTTRGLPDALPQILHDLGRCLQQAGQTQRALAAYREALAVAPQFWQVWPRRAQPSARTQCTHIPELCVSGRCT
jgi:tetratricopeptide (TPR) repeat protein